ncbi:hypothetical protein BECAL_00571, partial [Bellilinea caldifistulae]|uniref:hypothetical protein n=1 Tax=Bellilinea caldifistulae TaxID=360411 RepID=UPI001F45ADF0
GGGGLRRGGLSEAGFALRTGLFRAVLAACGAERNKRREETARTMSLGLVLCVVWCLRKVQAL